MEKLTFERHDRADVLCLACRRPIECLTKPAVVEVSAKTVGLVKSVA